MTTAKILILAMPFAVAAVACGDAGSTSDQTEGDETVPASEVLAHLDIAGEEIEFIRVGEGADRAFMIESTSPIRKIPVLDLLEAEYGELTLLETYYALRPGTEAPAPLIASHVEECAAMKRADATIRRFDFHADAQAGRFAVTKATDACTSNEDFFYDPSLTWSNKMSAASLGTDAYLCVSSSSNPQMGSGQPTASTCTFYTTMRKMAGICRNTPASMVTYSGASSQGGSWTTTESKTLAGNTARRYRQAATTTPRRLVVVGVGAQGQIFGLRSGTAR